MSYKTVHEDAFRNAEIWAITNPRRVVTDLAKMVRLLLDDEWADTFPSEPMTKMLEEQLHRLHNDLDDLRGRLETVLDAALDGIGAPEDHDLIRIVLRENWTGDSDRTPQEIEEALAVLCGASRNPVERIGIEFELANKSADPRAVDTLVEALDQTLREHGFQIEPKNEGFSRG